MGQVVRLKRIYSLTRHSKKGDKLMKKMLAVLYLCVSTLLQAETYTNLQLLYGEFDGDTAVYDTEDAGGKGTLTYESFSVNKVGDIFAFLDYTIADNRMYVPGPAEGDKTAFYGEIHPRLSLSYVSGEELSFGFIQDVFIATEVNAGSGADYRAIMGGLGVNMDVVGFDSFSTNLYYKHEAFEPFDYFSRNTVQLSLAYLSNFGKSGFSLSGWIDWTEYNFQTQNQFLYRLFNLPEHQSIDIGVEHLYYNEKADISNGETKSHTSVLQAMVKYSW